MRSMNGLIRCERVEEWMIIEKNDGSYVLCSLQSAEQSKLEAEGDHANLPTAI